MNKIFPRWAMTIPAIHLQDGESNHVFSLGKRRRDGQWQWGDTRERRKHFEGEQVDPRARWPAKQWGLIQLYSDHQCVHDDTSTTKLWYNYTSPNRWQTHPRQWICIVVHSEHREEAGNWRKSRPFPERLVFAPETRQLTPSSLWPAARVNALRLLQLNWVPLLYCKCEQSSRQLCSGGVQWWTRRD